MFWNIWYILKSFIRYFPVDVVTFLLRKILPGGDRYFMSLTRQLKVSCEMKMTDSAVVSEFSNFINNTLPVRLSAGDWLPVILKINCVWSSICFLWSPCLLAPVHFVGTRMWLLSADPGGMVVPQTPNCISVHSGVTWKCRTWHCLSRKILIVMDLTWTDQIVGPDVAETDNGRFLE